MDERRKRIKMVVKNVFFILVSGDGEEDDFGGVVAGFLKGGNINLVSDRSGATGTDVVTGHDWLWSFRRLVVGELAEISGVFEFTGAGVDIISGHVEAKAVGGGGGPGTAGRFVASGVVADSVGNVSGS